MIGKLLLWVTCVTSTLVDATVMMVTASVGKTLYKRIVLPEFKYIEVLALNIHAGFSFLMWVYFIFADSLY